MLKGLKLNGLETPWGLKGLELGLLKSEGIGEEAGGLNGLKLGGFVVEDVVKGRPVKGLWLKGFGRV